MKLKEFKDHFSTELSEYYPSEELQSFFSILSEYFLKLTRLDVVLNAEMDLSEENLKNYNDALTRLKNYEPIQYIIGETEFFGLTFVVNKHTLIPRPETEELVAWMLADRENQNSEVSILDIGTGSGCIAISLAKHLPNANVSAVDISKEALKMARQNAIENAVEVTFQELDILASKKHLAAFDIIVSNPPYVREREKSAMKSNVLNHEPSGALFVSDTDPLIFYRRIARFAQRHLSTDGILYFEINEYLSKELIDLLDKIGFRDIALKKDLFGKDRMLKCCK